MCVLKAAPVSFMALALAVSVNGAENNRVAELEKRVAELEKQKQPIRVGGAVRFQYSHEDYNPDNRERSGDLDFDIFRLNLDGEIGGVILSAEYRWFQYMDVIHHAWVGYKPSDQSIFKVGIHQVPFGNGKWNSHGFFFSSNYYLGLEDDYDAGLKFEYEVDAWTVDLAWYVTDEMGGIDGFVDDREDRYSYDVVGIRTENEDIWDDVESEVAEHNTLNARLNYTLSYSEDSSTKIGFSLLGGDLRDDRGSVGDRRAAAVHLHGQYGPWDLQLQATRYRYDLDNGGEDLVVGAYSFFDTIASEATSYTTNLAYHLPVSIGPVTGLTFYNDFSLVTNKSGRSREDTKMNALGVAVTAGAVYSYVELVSAKNQPFIGGSLAGNATDWNTRFNINVGYYF